MKLGKLLSVSQFVLLTLGSPSTSLWAAAVSQNEFWVSALPIPDPPHAGTIADPYDGSTQANFDSVMNNMPPNCTIHLLGGTYMTKGYPNGFSIKTGQRILGSGMDLTTIKLTNSAYCNVLGNSDVYASGIEVSDLTLDANAQNNGTTISFNGVVISGSRSAIRRIKVVNMSLGTDGPIEVWAISVIGYGGYNVSCDDVVIEDCVVTPIIAGNEMDGISVFAGDGGYVSARISGNWIYGTNNINLQAFNFVNSFDTLLIDNHVIGTGTASVGIYSDSGGNTNLTVVNNDFQNVVAGVALFNYVHQNIYIAGNTFELAYRPASWSAAVSLWIDRSGSFINEKIMGNTITAHDVVGNSFYAFLSDGTTNLIVADNSIDSRFGWYLAGCTNVNVHDNVDLLGNFLSSTNQVELPNSLTRTSLGPSVINYQAQNWDHYIGVTGVNGSGVTTITLPLALGMAGKEFIIADETGSKTIHIVASGGATINGSSNPLIFAGGYGSKTVISDGSNWFAR
jgi:hypothetical protein